MFYDSFIYLVHIVVMVLIISLMTLLIFKQKHIDASDKNFWVNDFGLFRKLNDFVKYVVRLRSQLYTFGNLPIYTKTLSHHSLMVITEKNDHIIISPHKVANIRVIDPGKIEYIKSGEDTYMKTSFGKFYEVGRKIQATKNVRAIDLVGGMEQILKGIQYHYLGKNCQYIVMMTMKIAAPKYAKRIESDGKKLFVMGVSELFRPDKYLKTKL